MLKQKNALPFAKHQLCVDNRDAKGRCCQSTFDVSRHVIRAFGCVHEERIAIWAQPAKKGLEIALHIRVRVFLNNQRRRGVAAIDGKQAVSACHRLHEFSDRDRNFVQTRTIGFTSEVVRFYAH